MNCKQLKRLCIERKVFYATNLRKKEIINLLITYDEHNPNIDYSNKEFNELKQICRERKIFHDENLEKEEVIELMRKNDKDILKIQHKIQQDREHEMNGQKKPQKDVEYCYKWFEKIEKEIEREPTNYWQKNLERIIG